MKNIIWGEEIRTFTYLLKGKETEKVENRLMRLLSCRARWEEDGKARGNKGDDTSLKYLLVLTWLLEPFECFLFQK